ncbi:MAG: FAD-binding protein [Gemmataceae bacterium]|nr:FAD-binding protein [Gemmataceae bacterium]
MKPLPTEMNTIARKLAQHTTAEVRCDGTARRLYATDASIYYVEPLGVVLPRTSDDLKATVQIAREANVSLVPRGGGTSLSGQSIGPGIVVDCSKYLNKVVDYDPSSRRVRVQPGVILDQLNRSLQPDGLWFGPDVATSSRANLGGMLGNNSAGSRSVVYGKTSDHTRRLHMLWADGSDSWVEPLTGEQWDRKAEQPNLEGGIYRSTREIVRTNAAEIRSKFPAILRRVSGYNLEGLLSQIEKGNANLIPLLVGSEGTLGFIAEAELDLVPRPKFRGLLVPHFSSLRSALDCVHECLTLSPSAVELLDDLLISLAAANLALKSVTALIEGRPSALLMVEFSGESQKEVDDRVEKCRAMLANRPGLTACVVPSTLTERDKLWAFRSSAVPLLYGIRGDRKPVTFVEDPAVAPDKLPEFADRFRAILHAHGTDGAFYGHASVGCLHLRPLLNLRLPDDIVRMRSIMTDVTDLVLEFGGSLSGEHGDGLVRSEWNRKMFGPTIYEAFRQIKRAFDPTNFFNPGKVVDAPAMENDLRQAHGLPQSDPPTVFDYSRQEGFFRSIELCNGSGVCRKTQGGTMCPSFRATRDERDSTRGRANALRVAIQEGATGSTSKPLAERWVYDVLDLCLMCKACKAECPSNVDLAKLKAEFLEAYYREHRRPLGHRMMANYQTINRIGSMIPAVVNFFGKEPFTRWLMEKLSGIDRRRSLPGFQREHFRKWFDSRPVAKGESGEVLFLDDCFTSYNEPGVGRSAVTVLEAAGYRVKPLGICCGRSLISKGFLKEARELARAGVQQLAAHAHRGTPILGVEPSCIVTLADEWPDLVPGDDARAISRHAALADSWLADRIGAGETTLNTRPMDQEIVFHGHCHQKALFGVQGSAAALSMVNPSVTVLDAGCCGMAGSFGYEHFDVSVQVANLELVPAVKAKPNAVIAATGTSCRHQIKDLTGRKARHPLEILADSLGTP